VSDIIGKYACKFALLFQTVVLFPPNPHADTAPAAAAAAGVMRIFAREKSLPALVHCAHGKDRTGVVIMLLLLVCDVPHEAIVQDYVQVRRLGCRLRL
jgi:protein tyrosine/serine phosphatase